MVISKPTGIQKEQFDNFQSSKEETDFKINTSQSLQSLRFAIETLSLSLKSAINDIAFLKSDYKSAFNDHIKSNAKTVSDFEQKLGGFKDQIAKMNLQFDSMLGDMKLKVSYEDLVKHQADMQLKFQIIHQEIDAYMRETRENIVTLSRQLEEKITRTKKEILSIPSEIPALQKALEQKLDLCDLNGQNSLLRSSNNEKQLQIIERKIENIYQLIKEIKLSQGKS